MESSIRGGTLPPEVPDAKWPLPLHGLSQDSFRERRFTGGIRYRRESSIFFVGRSGRVSH
ncbi:hypothetical protein SBA6_230030 [Candidatus Sulfopaludibacter sp. SbA6]|nr:hypothetical protein SBA6_230030 [Candidatus Sulfopaludibacter sp. SbA6]